MFANLPSENLEKLENLAEGVIKGLRKFSSNRKSGTLGAGADLQPIVSRKQAPAPKGTALHVTAVRANSGAL